MVVNRIDYLYTTRQCRDMLLSKVAWLLCLLDTFGCVYCVCAQCAINQRVYSVYPSIFQNLQLGVGRPAQGGYDSHSGAKHSSIVR